jgi:hypothetical protein
MVFLLNIQDFRQVPIHWLIQGLRQGILMINKLDFPCQLPSIKSSIYNDHQHEY